MKIDKKVNKRFKGYVLDWDYGYYFLVGGYGSSKSYHTALKIILKLLTERRTCLVVRNVYDTIRDSCYALFWELCGDLGLERAVEFNRSPMQMKFYNGSKIIFRGLDKPEKLKSIHNVSLIWIEECSECSYDAFKELVGRLRHPSLRLHMILSTNPTSKSNWTYKHFFESRGLSDGRLYKLKILRENDTYYHHSTADDNKYLPESYIKTLDEMKNYDPDLYRIARQGRFGTNGTKVFPQFEVMTRAEVLSAVSKIPARYKKVGMDFGFVTSFNAVVRVAIDDINKWLYIYWEYYRRDMTDDETARALADFIDTQELIKADSAEPKAIRYYQKCGFNMTATRKWSGGTRHAVLDSVKKLKRFKRIICADDCENVIAEWSDLVYKRDKDGNIYEDEFNRDAHTLDAVRYALDDYDVSDIKGYFTRRDIFGY